MKFNDIIESNILEIGSKDANSTVPHDNAIVRACNANYRPNHRFTNNPQTTLFIGRLTDDESVLTITIHLSAERQQP